MKPRVIAFYLPQYHPIPENNAWWGKGFTEWSNVTKAKPLFPGHYQPHIPADLGFYDLRVPETRFAQAEMAREFGVEAFCYYHYWFAGRRLLERPFDEVLKSGEPDFPFCLCWANESWSGIWHGQKNKILMEQAYPVGDAELHFKHLLAAFTDPRYLLVEGKPIVLIYKPADLPGKSRYTDTWREMAHRAGLKGLYLVGVGNHETCGWTPRQDGFDGWVRPTIMNARHSQMLINRYLMRGRLPTIHSYKKLQDLMVRNTEASIEKYPCVIPNWDNTPRSGTRGHVVHGSTPELFRLKVRKALEMVANDSFKHKIIFLKSWNEWAEGNHMEPDRKYGKSYLEVLGDEIRTVAS